MYERMLEKANFWAQKSCSKWNKNRLSRRYYRRKYRNLVDWYCTQTGDGYIRSRRSIRERSLDDCPEDTYPWPYRDEKFADWPEDDDPENYTLVSDQSGCVIKYSTSYCAWKIYELMHLWPQKTSKERLDARRWVQFLNEAGYKEVADTPKADEHYVGVNPNVGEWGEVVWFERFVKDDTFIATFKPNGTVIRPSRVLVSTYIDKKYHVGTVDPSDYAWVKIS